MSALIFLRLFSVFASSAARSTFLSMFVVVVGLITRFVVGLLVGWFEVFGVVIRGLVSGVAVAVVGLAVVEHVVVGLVDDGLVLVGLAVVLLRHNFLSMFELSKSPLVC